MDEVPEVESPLQSKASIEEDLLLFRIPPQQDHSRSFTKLIIVSIMCVLFIAGEIVGGIISHSISVISDATHLITDLIGFILSFVFLYYSSRHADDQKSFGFHRLQIVGALANLFIIWVVALFLVVESTSRIINKQFVEQPTVMLIVACSGLLVNIGMYFVLHSGTGGHSHGLGQECSHPHPDQHHHETADQLNLKVSLISESAEESVAEHNQHEASGKHQHEHQHEHGHRHTHQHHHEHGQHDQHHGHKKPHVHVQEHVHLHKQPLHSHHQHTHEHHHHKGKGEHPISMKAAILHAVTDIIQSVGLVVSSIVIFFLGSDHGAKVTEFNPWHYLDPITTYVFSVLVVYSTWPITKLCFNIILEATPETIKPGAIREQFKHAEDMKDVHDFHIWQLKPGKIVLTAHVSAARGKERSVLKQLTKICRRNKIYHSTIQVEQHELLGKDTYIRCDNDID